MPLLILWYHFKEVILWHGNTSLSKTAYNNLFESVENTFLLKLNQTLKLWVWYSQNFFITKIFHIPVYFVNWADMTGLSKNNSHTKGGAAWRKCYAGSRAEWQSAGAQVACLRSLGQSPTLQKKQESKKRGDYKKRKRKEQGGEGGMSGREDKVNAWPHTL